jgi:glycerol-3-phosphate dehydrogenase (NAD(P)+)
MKIAMLGAGAWGTALAIALSKPQGVLDKPNTVTLWARDEGWLHAAQSSRTNERYLPGIEFPGPLVLSASPLKEWLCEQDLVVISTPMAALRGMLESVQALSCALPVVWLCKGFEAPQNKRVVLSESKAPTKTVTGLMAHEVLQEAASTLTAGILSGPSFAREVALGQPTALVAASPDPKLRELMVQAFHGPQLRVYANEDWLGVEVGGAVKNVMAIACGICDGLNLGMNARAALITRGLVEITRLGLALGAKSETLMGLSGLGDLVLTATGDLSRNRQVGLALAKGRRLSDIVKDLGHVAEGVYSAETVLIRALALGVEMPITQMVVNVLKEELTPQEAMKALMARQSKLEY